MENIIFAALLYILVPVFLLWLNHESATANQLVDTQLKNNTTATNLSHQSTINDDIKPAFTESNLLNYKCAEARLDNSQSERCLSPSDCDLGSPLGLRKRRGSQSLHTNTYQKTSENKVPPTIQKLKSQENEPDYQQLTIRQLKKIAQKRKIKRYGTMKKQDLILALTS